MIKLVKLSRRFSALMLALVMLMTGFVVPAYAQADWDQLAIRLSWTDADGNTQEAYAEPVEWSQDQSYWVQVTADAPLSALTMNISHPDHDYVFDPADGSTLMDVVDASSLDGLSAVVIDAYENDALADTFNLYVSTQIQMPEEPTAEPTEEPTPEPTAEPTPEPVRATVHVVYMDIFGNPLGENYVELVEGEDDNNTIYAPAIDGYNISGADSVFVSVTADGASHETVEFYYAKILAQIPVLVQYKDQNGNVLGENTVTLTEGDDANNTVYAQEIDGYTLTSEGSVFVSVTADGANPNPVEFWYTKNLAQVPVQVQYKDQNGNVLGENTVTLTEGDDANNTVYAQEIDGYTLTSEGSVFVSVTADGASPNPVEFWYTKNLAQVPVQVQYKDIFENILDEETVTLTEGNDANNTIYAKQIDGYSISGAESVFVTVTAEGASPNPVVFYYAKNLATAEVAVTYQSDDGLIYETETRTMTEGGEDNTVYAREYEGYTLSPESASTVTVEVTAEGANPAAVTFYYNKILPKQADVLVRHVNTDGEPLAEDAFVTCYEGQENAFEAQQYEGYTLQSDAVVYVTVNSDGTASHTEVVFVYEKDAEPTEEPTEAPTEVPTEEPTEAPTEVPTEEPTEAPAEVPTEEPTEAPTEVPTEEPTEAPTEVPTEEPTEEPTEVPTEEPTEAPTEVPTEEPTEAPTEVPTEEPTEVPTEEPTEAPMELGRLYVYFRNYDNVDVAAPVSAELEDGQYRVIANPADLMEGYVLDGEAEVLVTVANGVVDPAEVVFYYVKDEPVEIPTEIPTEEPTKVPTEEPTEAPTEVPTEVPTATPTAEPTATPVAETPIPQGEMINRFGTITKAKTALREGPGKDHDIVTRLAKGTVVYMLREELNEKGQPWVRVLVDGATYYISADCIEHMTQADSDNWMANEMATPVPPFTAGQLDHPDQPTEEPTAEPTEEPTATPTAEPTAEPTEEPTAAPTKVPDVYTGYALTTTNVAVRSKVGGGVDTILRVADVKELMMVTGQEFVDGNTWSAVTNLDGVSGYVLDNNLRHINNEEAQYYIDLWNDVHATAIPTEVPTEAPTPTPTAAPTAEPAQYAGYALTTGTVALRTEISSEDASILRTLEKNELVMVSGQSFSEGESWSLSTTLDNVSGYIPDSGLRRINNEEAAYYLDLWEQAHPTATPTAAPVTPEPAKISGYAYTVGDDVYFRHQASSMASIIDVLSKDVVVYVRDQDYQSGEAWHVVQYDGQWGYIRADMLRMMSVQEENAYLDSLTTPEPTPEATIEPPSSEGLSSYGYVNDSSVNFRKEANTSSSRIRQLKQYAFCLVLGTTEVDGVTWYRVSYGGQEGYVHGKYFKQMTIAELEEFLDSDEYLKGIQNNTTAGNTDQDFTTGGGIVSAEDQTVDQWTNPNSGVQVSYEPFDPFATVAPLETPVPTETVTIPVAPTATLEPIPTMDVTYPTGNDERGGSGILGWVIAVVLIAVIGGGVYAYVTYTNNKRKAAQRAAARRAQAAAQQRQNEARPYARSTQANQPRTGTYPNQAAQRPMSGAAQQVRKPAAQQPVSYARPVENEQPQQADYTASYRNPNTAETARPVGRRSAYRAQQTQQSGYTASYRNEQENGDFQQEKDNGDFE